MTAQKELGDDDDVAVEIASSINRHLKKMKQLHKAAIGKAYPGNKY